MSISLGPQGYPIPPTPVIVSPSVTIAAAPVQPQPALQVTPAAKQDASDGSGGRSDTPNENQANPNGTSRGRLVNISA